MKHRSPYDCSSYDPTDRTALDEFEAIVRALASLDPSQDLGNKFGCYVCGAEHISWPDLKHKPTCLWLRARKAMGIEVKLWP